MTDKLIYYIFLLALTWILYIPIICAGTFMNSMLELFKYARETNNDNYLLFPSFNDSKRYQRQVSPYTPFPCDTLKGRSPVPPENVHHLRPGDIDVIAGIGDSLVAASGALEQFAIGTFIEARGVSWCAGGEATWRKYLTLPNILKVFNPDLNGYSTGTGEFISRKARFNVAYPVAATEDALYQAKLLVRRIKSDPNINIKKHWKLITVFFGANDICSAQCYKPELFSPAKYALHLRRALDFLRATLPRTFVNLVPVIDVTVSMRVERSMMCKILHPLYCSCMHKGNEPIADASKMSRLYQQAAEDLIMSGRYDTTPDFTVVIQPFIKMFNAPISNPANASKINSNLVTYDCFHFSQRGHALGANLLWNNMLEPVGNKTVHSKIPNIMDRILCPTDRKPYIFTNLNSKYNIKNSSEKLTNL